MFGRRPWAPGEKNKGKKPQELPGPTETTRRDERRFF